jgi:hypothetical protein
LFTESLHGDQQLVVPAPSTVCLSSVCCLLFGFFCWRGSVCQGGYAGLSQGWLVEYRVTLGAHLLVWQVSPKQVWSQQPEVVAAHLFSQCNMAWRSFLWTGGSGCQNFDSPWCFISVKCGSSVSARFLIHSAHAICF